MIQNKLFLFFLASSLANCLFPSPLAAGSPLLDDSQRSLLRQVCTAQSYSPVISRFQAGILLVDPEGRVAGHHDALDEALRAENFAEAGAVVCLEPREVELETCAFGVFLTVPRIRQDILVSIHSLQSPLSTIPESLIHGPVPPSCDEAGDIEGSTDAIRGDPPGIAGIRAFLDEAGLDTGDDDGDGLNNLAEFIAGTDPLDPASPGARIAVYANDATHLNLEEGEALTVTISLFPGPYQGLPGEYRVYADTAAGLFSYLHPDGFRRAPDVQAALRAPAATIPAYRLATLPALGQGDYRVVFELAVENGPVLSSDAEIRVTNSPWRFTDVTANAGFDYRHGYGVIAGGISRDRQIMAAGVAAGDYDQDGWQDLYITRGSIGPNLLFRNRGDGSFEETGANAGVDLTGRQNSGAVFADVDGDGWPDLFVTGINDTQPSLFRNRGDGSFEDITTQSGFRRITQSMGASFGDYDRDGDLDLWITHWTASNQGAYLWRNDGSGHFEDVSTAAGIPDGLVADYTANFADIDNDGWPDLLVAGDFGTSQVFINNRAGGFSLATTGVITDENGMGGAVGDYDNDGDLDWFVSSILDPLGDRENVPGVNWGATGNRFYRNTGDGMFEDVTDMTGTRRGYWGWGSCLADFNNDGFLDLFHVNGWKEGNNNTSEPFTDDPSRLFVSDRAGGFLERSVSLGIDDTRQGRGIVCFDYDRDGDVDIFIANNEQAPRLYRNDSSPRNNFLHIRLGEADGNSEAVGARITLHAGGLTQMRELRAGNNFMSGNPVEAYFGLGKTSHVDEIHVLWPSGQELTLRDISVNQLLFIPAP